MRHFKSILSVNLALALCVSSAFPVLVSADEAESDVIAVWADPSSDESENAKPMLRFWFPDAGAGLTQAEIEDLYEQGLTEYNEEYLYEVSDIINELYDAGFGGVELTMLADSANYGTELVSQIGWGTPAWVRILCQALETGNALGKGDGTSFKIDITMTAHWPLIIDTIDPNDAAQQQELSYTTQEIDPDNLEDRVVLDLPDQDTADGKSGTFLFTDTLVGVTLAKMKMVDNDAESDAAVPDGAPAAEEAAPAAEEEAAPADDAAPAGEEAAPADDAASAGEEAAPADDAAPAGEEAAPEEDAEAGEDAAAGADAAPAAAFGGFPGFGEPSGPTESLDLTSLTTLEATGEAAYRAGVPEGSVIYQYTDGRYYDLALAGTGDELGDPLQEGESVILLPSADYYTFVDEENGGYIYIVDNATGEAVDAEGLEYERVDSTTQMGPMISHSSSFIVTKNGEDISDSVTVYFDSGVATNMSGKLVAADGSMTDIATISNSSRATFGIVTEEEATEEKPATERQYMDDVQYVYSVSADDIRAAIAEQDELEEGESWVLVPVYRRGSGQVSSGGGTITMDGRTYCIDYYDEAGAQAVIDYWEENMLDLPVDVYDADGNTVTVTLREQLAGNAAGSIFEDSLEMSTSGTAWCADMLEEFQSYIGYDASAYLPILAGMDVYNDENGVAADVEADFGNLKEELFNDKHSAVISAWANEIGGGYRFQSGSDDAERSANVDIIEADNGSLSSVLKAVGTVNTKGDEENPYLSMEAITSTSIDPNYYMTMIELNMNFVRGINRIVIHGIPFTKSLNGHINAWPGWVFGETALGKGYGAWDSRQPFYNEESDIHTFTDYVTRIQGLLQDGQEQVPVLIVGSDGDAAFADLRAKGYHYNETSEYGVMFDNMDAANITDGVLNPDGIATQVVVLDNLGASVDQYEFLERLVDYAEAGMTIVVYGDTNISALNGADCGEFDGITDEKQTNAYAAELFEKLCAYDNVVTGISTSDELLAVLDETIGSPITFDADGLEAVQLKEDALDFYFLYNSALEDGYSAINYGGVGEDLNLTNVKGKDLTVDITIANNGAPIYQLDAYTGEITARTDAADNGDGTATLTLAIDAWDTAVFAVGEGITADKEYNTAEAEVVMDLSDAAWDLTIESYGPSSDFDETAQFNLTTITEMNFEDITLGLWNDMTDLVTRDDLIAAGITDEKLEAAAGNITGKGEKLLNGESLTVDENAIQYISGIGTYTTTFEWNEDCDGAIVKFYHQDDAKDSDSRMNGDMITKLTIENANGIFEFTGIDPISDKVDIGNVLAQGENTITVRLVTSLRDREWIEGAATGPSYNTMHTYGLTGLTISTY